MVIEEGKGIDRHHALEFGCRTQRDGLRPGFAVMGHTSRSAVALNH